MMSNLYLSSSVTPFSLYNKQHVVVFSLHKTPPSAQSSSRVVNFNRHAFTSNPLRVSSDSKEMMKKNGRRFGAVCYSAPLSPQNLQLISTVSSAILMLARGTGIHKSFLVPLFALQAPTSIVSWIKGEYGVWTAFLALLVRLFFSIPGELELPFIALLLLIVAPYEAMNLRGRQEGIVLSLAIAAYLAFQHFSRAGSLRKSFDQGSIVATLAIICIVAVPCLLLI